MTKCLRPILPRSGYRTSKTHLGCAWTVTFRRAGKFPGPSETNLPLCRSGRLRDGDPRRKWLYRGDPSAGWQSDEWSTLLTDVIFDWTLDRKSPILKAFRTKALCRISFS